MLSSMPAIQQIGTHTTAEKHVGETPLQVVERLRKERNIPERVPLAYAGRLDPMASGKLLVLIGSECKNQRAYHALDKEYQFEVLFGVRTDTADVLGIAKACEHPRIETAAAVEAAKKLTGKVELPYPHFSSKTVHGKPLHTWALEDRLDEIEIPRKNSRIYKLDLQNIYTIPKAELQKTIFKKINALPQVTEPSKALGNDFRRTDVRQSWKDIFSTTVHTEFTVARFSCTASSGTYMRTLAEALAEELSTCGIAFSIHRPKIGTYVPIFGRFGFWRKQY